MHMPTCLISSLVVENNNNSCLCSVIWQTFLLSQNIYELMQKYYTLSMFIDLEQISFPYWRRVKELLHCIWWHIPFIETKIEFHIIILSDRDLLVQFCVANFVGQKKISLIRHFFQWFFVQTIGKLSAKANLSKW